MAHFAVIGAGSWGTAMAVQLARSQANSRVYLLCRSAAAAEQMQREGQSAKYLAGVQFPANLIPTSNAAQLKDAALTLIGTPFAGLNDALSLAQSLGLANAVWLCKGLDSGSGAMAHELAKPFAQSLQTGVLSGPSFAQEVGAGLPFALTVAASSAELSSLVQSALHQQNCRIYTSSDIVGVEIGGAVKNIIALASGVSDGLKLGQNARAALITRGLAEMMRFGLALGAKTETFLGLTGVGDLMLTCAGDLSRNRRYGLLLAGGASPSEIETQLGHVAEGARCVHAVLARAQALGVELPITAAVSKLVKQEISPKEAIQQLLTRSAKAEI